MIALFLALATTPVTAPMPGFLSGCWIDQRESGRWTEECWTGPRGGLMMGSGRSGTGDSVRHWEWMRIERDAAGNPAFFASSKGTPAISFPLHHATATEIEWRNPAHDYPQRIVYRRTTTGLEAEISLIDGSKPNRWTYRSPPAPSK